MPTTGRPRALLAIAALTAALAAPAAPVAAQRARQPAHVPMDTAAFYAWWLRGASTDVGPGGDSVLVPLPPGVSSLGTSLTGLRPPPVSRATRPAELEGEQWTPLALVERGDETLLLWLPTDTTGLATPGGACEGNRSRLGVGPRGEWTPVRLNPFCDETYSPAEADVILYWLDGEEWPHVEIVTNGPACIPAELYRFDARTRRYVKVREACA